MKQAFLLFILIYSSITRAKTPLILGPNANLNEFNNYLNIGSEHTSWKNYQIQKIISNEEQEDALFQRLESFSLEPSKTIQLIKDYESQAALSRVSLEFLRDFTLFHKKGDTPIRVQEEIHRLYCKTSQLLSDSLGKGNCSKTKMIDLSLLKQSWTANNIFVESFNLKEISHNIDPEQTYNWTIFFDDQFPFTFFGKFEEFVQQTPSTNPIIEGSCEEFKLKNDIQGPLDVFFSSSCIKNKSIATTAKPWFEQHRTYIVLGSAIVTSAALFYFSDKTLKIKISY